MPGSIEHLRLLLERFVQSIVDPSSHSILADALDLAADIIDGSDQRASSKATARNLTALYWRELSKHIDRFLAKKGPTDTNMAYHLQQLVEAYRDCGLVTDPRLEEQRARLLDAWTKPLP